jgi:hypothetical protein
MVILTERKVFVNRFAKKIQKNYECEYECEGAMDTGHDDQQTKRQMGRLRCALCRGSIFPGEDYYRLEGRAVCEDCLDRFARRYFSGERRRAGGKGAASCDDI